MQFVLLLETILDIKEVWERRVDQKSKTLSILSNEVLKPIPLHRSVFDAILPKKKKKLARRISKGYKFTENIGKFPHDYQNSCFFKLWNPCIGKFWLTFWVWFHPLGALQILFELNYIFLTKMVINLQKLNRNFQSPMYIKFFPFIKFAEFFFCKKTSKNYNFINREVLKWPFIAFPFSDFKNNSIFPKIISKFEINLAPFLKLFWMKNDKTKFNLIFLSF